MDSDFETWWLAYPKPGRVAKAACIRKWDVLAKKKVLPPIEDLLAATERYANSRNPRRGYIMGAHRWLNEQRWEDEYDEEEDPLAQVIDMASWRARAEHPSSGHATGRG